MGIFVDKCTALVNPETGKALTGEALEEAKQVKKWPVCGNKVPKKARFCNKCGSGATGGWFKCPSCKKWIGNSSSFCPHCNQPLNHGYRSDIAGGVWDKQAGLLAQRFEIGDIKRLLKQDLQVQAGTVGLMMDGGRFKGIIESGQYNPDSLARKINHFGSPPPRSVILLESGEVILPFHFENLMSAENYPLEFFGELIVKFHADNKGAKEFIENAFKDRKEFQYSDLIDLLSADIRHSVDAMCVKSNTEDLVRDPKRRLDLESEIETYARAALKSYGFDLLRVSSTEFTGEEYEALAEQMGDVAAKRCGIEYDQKMRAVLDEDKMFNFKSDAELVEYQESLAHEYGIRSERRDHDLQMLRQGWNHELGLDEIRKEFEADSAKLTNELELDKLGYAKYMEELKHTIEVKKRQNAQGIDDAETQAKIDKIKAAAEAERRKIAFEQEAAEVEKALDWRAKKNKLKTDKMRDEVEIRKGLSPMELLVTTDDAGQRKDILATLKMQGEAGMTPEQLLAKAAETSTAAAEALAKMKDDGARYKELLVEMKSLYKDTAERQDKNLKVMLEPANEAAKRQDGDQTIVK